MADAPRSYCEYVAGLERDNLHRIYHDTAYGFPLDDDNALFERLILEINQAGLSWDLMLRKQENFRAAYDGFDIAAVAAYGEAERERLLNDAGIVRNRLKVGAAIHNANVILGLQREHCSFKAWLDQCHPLSKADWTKLFKKTFKFTGGEIVGEFLMSCGYLPGAHVEDCPVHAEILELEPPWTRK
ncbi:DNA-3-methyladenine glycosylase I [Pseudodesulfovibrio cashew]|uniref:DNA-3-methyladenine glycosylase I n=1 Tax=Pseudodesulfovibrio cashew TaxID=2678688 RepID=A0A6I6JKL3_9BACT|nr:DNA-3-methyladenine glycosylase I [Pseudodesulfovibrio cashew]QGY40667.1 DNA-3-methyladenine glycosylase I [Pseudodesulfovibrio cashew]